MNLSEMSWPQVGELSRDIPVVVPVAALEQHGGHLPVFVDSMLLGEVIRRASEQLSNEVLFTPLMWLGNSDHHMDFQGTMSAPARVYLDLLNAMAENLIFHGFKRIIFLNGHGGNIVPTRQSVFELRQKHRDRSDLLLLCATYWDCARPHETRSDLVQQRMGHACEWETSMILRLTPHLVGEISGLETVPFAGAFEPASRGWITKEYSYPGHIGSPQEASADKGEHLFTEFSNGVVELLRRAIDWDGSEI